MTGFNIQQVKNKLEIDLKYAAEKSADFKKGTEVLLKDMKENKLGNSNERANGVSDEKELKEEDEAMAKMEAEFNESLDKAIIEFATKEPQ